MAGVGELEKLLGPRCRVRRPRGSSSDGSHDGVPTARAAVRASQSIAGVGIQQRLDPRGKRKSLFRPYRLPTLGELWDRADDISATR